MDDSQSQIEDLSGAPLPDSASTLATLPVEATLSSIGDLGEPADHHVRVPAPFRALEVVATGGMGSVWRGVDDATGEAVAIKVPRRMGREHAARLREEFRSAQLVVHPSLVALRELFAEQDPPVVVMEWVDGVELSTLRASGDRLREVLLALVDALGALHDHGVVHRDVKARNVLVEPSGRVVLVDFGLALPTMADAGAFQPAGTVSHMAPELLRGEAATPASDLYAVGVMLYRLLVGKVPAPFRWRRQLEVKEAQWFPPPHHQRPDVDRLLSDLTMDLLAPDPAQRPNIAEVRRRLGAESMRDGSWIPRPRLEARLLGWLTHPTHQSFVVSGASGFGKTALVGRVLARSPIRDVLWGTCSPLEHSALGGLDAIADQLLLRGARYQGPTWDEAARRAATVFPVFRERTDHSQRSLGPADLAEAEAGLARMVELLATAGPLAVVLDDAQWASPEGMDLWRRLVKRHISQVWWIRIDRTEETGDTDAAHRLIVGEVDRDTLVAAGLPVADARESVPAYAIRSLDRRQMGDASRWNHATVTTWRSLPEDQARLVGLLSLCPAPLERSHLAKLGLRLGDIRACVAAGLAWVHQAGDAQLVSTAHARVTQAISPHVPAPEERHRELSAVLVEAGPRWAAHAAHHLSQCGERLAAHVQLGRAAAWLVEGGLFQSAETHLRRLREERAPARLWAELLGYVWSALGRPADALALWRSMLDGAPPPLRAQLRLRIGELLVASGELADGVEALETTLREVGEPVPSGGLPAVWGALVAPALGVRPSGPVAGLESDGARRAEATWATARALSLVDPLQSLVLHTRHEWLARHLDLPMERARALAWRLWLTLAEHGEAEAVEAAIIENVGVPYEEWPVSVRFDVVSARAYGWYLAARWSHAAMNLEAALEDLDAWVGNNWEARFTRAAWVQARVEHDSLPLSQERIVRIRAGCRRRGDRLGLAALDLAVGYQVAMLIEGTPEAGEAVIESALEYWGQALLPDLAFRLLAARAHIALARKDGEAALALLDGAPMSVRALRRFRLPRLILDSLTVRALQYTSTGWWRARRVARLVHGLRTSGAPALEAVGLMHAAAEAKRLGAGDQARMLRDRATPVLRRELHGLMADALALDDDALVARGVGNPDLARAVFVGPIGDQLRESLDPPARQAEGAALQPSA